ncbi:hypothetical protein ACFL3S_02535 [Gemmatimonadota bacterium]
MDRKTPPDDLSEESRRLWEAATGDEPARWKPTMVALLNEGLRARDRAQQARAVLEREGVSFTSDSGLVRAHPLLRVEKDASGLFLRIWRALGLEWR